MDALSKLTFTSLLAEAAGYACAALLLVFFGEAAGGPWAGLSPWGAALVALLFLLYSVAASAVYVPALRRGGKQVMAFYLLAKTLRLLMAILLLLVYAIAFGGHTLAFAINLFVLYVVGLVASTVFYARAERITSKKQ